MNELLEPTLLTLSRGDHRLAADVLWLGAPDGTSRFLDLGGAFHALDAVGTDMLRAAFDEGVGTSKATLTCRYGVSPEQIHEDLLELLGSLAQAGLVVRRDERDPPQSCRLQAQAIDLTVRMTGWFCLPFWVRARLLIVAAGLSFAGLGWGQTVALWADCFPVRDGSAPSGRDNSLCTVKKTMPVVVAGSLPGVTCKETALVAWALCRSSGVLAELVLGVSLYPLASHCWVEAGGRVLTDFEDRCEPFTPVARYL